MGGALSLASAVLAPQLSAAVVFYGTPPLALADPVNVRAPVQGHFGDLDAYKGFSDLEVRAERCLRARQSTGGCPLGMHEAHCAGSREEDRSLPVSTQRDLFGVDAALHDGGISSSPSLPAAYSWVCVH